MIVLKITGLAGYENDCDIYLSYALNEAYTLRQGYIIKGSSTVQFYICTAIVMLLLLSGIYEGNMKGRAGRLQRALKVQNISI
ncbi:MAG: hypothetical protein ACLT33_11900 [Lachnospira pectinoschiza]